MDYKKSMLEPISKENIERVLKINSCITPEHWNQGMYDAFMLGYKLGIQ